MRGGGLVAGRRSSQFVPSHSHVSTRDGCTAPKTLPPKRTTRFRAASYAISPPRRQVGVWAGARRTQPREPHTQVSLAPPYGLQTRRTTSLRAASYAAPCASNAGFSLLV